MNRTNLRQGYDRQACRQCQKTFEISDGDLSFYKMISPKIGKNVIDVPPPTLCPDCRLQRRLVFRNQLYVYQRPSSATSKTIFSRFTPDVPFPVAENDWWYSDQWDGLDYGRVFDPKQTFFEQFRALRDTVPHRALSLHQAENSDFCNNCTGTKNCYLVFNTTKIEDCMYCENCNKAKDCVDCTYCPASELCYDCTMCERCYNLQSSEFCEDCSDSTFLSHCTGCKNCFGSINLTHKEYCAFNKQYSPEEYRKVIASFRSSSFASREETRTYCTELWSKHPRPHALIHNSESVTGNHILNSKNIHQSFFVQDSEDLRYCMALYDGVKTSCDFSFFGRDSELIYEAVQCGIGDHGVAFSVDCWDGNSDLWYSWMCHGCQHCFGCVGLRKKKYCILNTQYTKAEYEELMPRIIDHMRKTKEWGEFFPMNLSPTPYNHSIAQRYFPIAETDVTKFGCRWYSRETEDVSTASDAQSLPDDLPSNDNPIVVKSTESNRPFRITSQEIKRYRKIGAPLPRTTYDERMAKRMNLLGGLTLFARTCDKTGKPIQSTYGPDTPFPVWDREEYNKEFRG